MRKTPLKSLKTKFMLFVLLGNIPLIILASVVLYYSALTLEQRTLEVREQSLISGISVIDRLLERAKTTLYINYNLSYFNKYTTAISSQNDSYFLYQDIREILDSYASANDTAVSFFSYTPKDDYLILDQSSSLLGNKDPFLSYLDGLTFPSDNGQWHIVTLNDYSILTYPLKIGQNIMGFYVRLNDLLPFIPAPADTEGMFLIGEKGMSASDLLPSVSPVADSHGFSDSGLLLDISSTSEYGYTLYYIYPRQTLIQNATLSFYIIVGMVLLSLFLLPCSILFVSRFVFRPLNRLNYGLMQLQQDDLSYRMNERLSSTEFNTLSHSFNVMSQRILDLKAEILKREEEKRKSELSWLKHQIQPHFLFNNMNLIYTLAQDPPNHKIQQLSSYLTGYMRYSLRVDQAAVPLSDEIRHLKDYLSILAINYPGRIHDQIDCDHRLFPYTVPTFLLNTVLENSVNYGFSSETDTLELTIRIFLSEAGQNDHDSRYLHIRIADTGPGFSPQTIAHVNRFEDFNGYFSTHIGLRNIRYRLWLTYGETDLLRISNRTEGGAMTEIRIPVTSRSGHEEEQDEYPDY